jgi:hypothetical protein
MENDAKRLCTYSYYCPSICLGGGTTKLSIMKARHLNPQPLENEAEILPGYNLEELL